MKFDRDRSINVELCEDIKIVAGKVYMSGAFIQFIDPAKFLKEFDVDEYLRLRNQLNFRDF